MKYKVIITGTTGMVGKGVLLECLDSNDIESVLIINRKPLGMQHEKLTEIIHANFLDFSPIADQLAGYDACFFCLGISSAGISKEKYYSITHDLTLHVAKTLLDKNPEMIFNYVSGTGTDSTEKGRSNWARVKGKTENELLAMPFKKAYMFRPGYIQPMRGIKSATPLYNFFYLIFKPLYPLLKLLFPNNVTSSDRVGQAMIKSVTIGTDKTHLENRDINELAMK